MSDLTYGEALCNTLCQHNMMLCGCGQVRRAPVVSKTRVRASSRSGPRASSSVRPSRTRMSGAPPFEVKVQLRPCPPGVHAEITHGCQHVEDVQRGERAWYVGCPFPLRHHVV